jgi:hypothetical protein
VKRTTAEANDNNRYSEGNPSLGIPATVVGAEELNNIQEEIVNVVLDAGITLNGADETQLLQALNIILERGGTQIDQAIDDNAGATNITGAVWAKADIKGARCLFEVDRRNDSQDATEIGELFAWHNAESDTWHVELDSKGDDAGVVFSITSAGQLQYASSAYAGTGYAGNLRITNITTFAQ